MGMPVFSTPLLLSMISPSSVCWRIDTNAKEIFLTIDDGPNPGSTQEILAILKDFEARASFFCQGKQVEKHPGIFEKIILEGHAVGNHTYSHIDGWRSTRKAFRDDVEKCASVFSSGLFRPPYGNLPLFELDFLKQRFKIIMWSLMSYDYDERIDKERINAVFQKKTKPGTIWVFHDNERAKRKCLELLPALIDYFSRKGFRFESLKG